MSLVQRLGIAVAMIVLTPVFASTWVVFALLVAVGYFEPYQKDGLTFGVRRR